MAPKTSRFPSLGIPVGHVQRVGRLHPPHRNWPLRSSLGELAATARTITTLGSPGTLLPESTGFLIDEFGLGYGNVLEESMNSAGTSATVGDFILTPFGDENITPIVDLFLPQGVGITDAAGAVDPSSFADLLSSF